MQDEDEGTSNGSPPSSSAILRGSCLGICESGRSIGIGPAQTYAPINRELPQMLHNAYAARLASFRSGAIVIIAAVCCCSVARAVDQPTLSATVIDGASA